jgi:hypothetical protein
MGILSYSIKNQTLSIEFDPGSQSADLFDFIKFMGWSLDWITLRQISPTSAEFEINSEVAQVFENFKENYPI